MSALFRIVMIAALLLASQGLASARGQARIAGEMVLCAGGELITVQIDENGRPVERIVICPDMALNLMAAVHSSAPQPKLSETVIVLPRIIGAGRCNGSEAPIAQARAPPVGICTA